MATYNNIKKLKIGDNVFNLYDSGNSGGTITSIKTTAGAHTTVNVTSGAASFNVPTHTSHLTNDSGFITDITQNPTTLALGTYVTTGILTNGGKTLMFSIPTGRVLAAGAAISKITFNIIARVANCNASGVYMIKKTSGGSDTVSFDSSKSCTFYNANNVQQTLTTSMWTIKSINGNTNLYFNISGTSNYFYSGTATINGYINNQPVAVYLDQITITFTYS